MTINAVKYATVLALLSISVGAYAAGSGGGRLGGAADASAATGDTSFSRAPLMSGMLPGAPLEAPLASAVRPTPDGPPAFAVPRSGRSRMGLDAQAGAASPNLDATNLGAAITINAEGLITNSAGPHSDYVVAPGTIGPNGIEPPGS